MTASIANPSAGPPPAPNSPADALPVQIPADQSIPSTMMAPPPNAVPSPAPAAPMAVPIGMQLVSTIAGDLMMTQEKAILYPSFIRDYAGAIDQVELAAMVKSFFG
jgi:hypothetical protein